MQNATTVMIAIVTGLLAGCLESGADHVGTTVAPLHVVPAAKRIPGEYIVVLRDGVTLAARDTLRGRVASAGTENQVLGAYSIIPGFAAALDDDMLAELRRSPEVAHIEENAVIQLASIHVAHADGIDRLDQRVGHDGVYNDYDWAGAGVHVYVVDTGLNRSHDDFAGRVGLSFTTVFDGNVVNDCHGHGTHVTSTIAGTRYGVAKQAEVHAVRIFDCNAVGTLNNLIQGVEWATDDCRGPGAAPACSTSATVCRSPRRSTRPWPQPWPRASPW